MRLRRTQTPTKQDGGDRDTVDGTATASNRSGSKDRSASASASASGNEGTVPRRKTGDSVIGVATLRSGTKSVKLEMPTFHSAESKIEYLKTSGDKELNHANRFLQAIDSIKYYYQQPGNNGLGNVLSDDVLFEVIDLEKKIKEYARFFKAVDYDGISIILEKKFAEAEGHNSGPDSSGKKPFLQRKSANQSFAGRNKTEHNAEDLKKLERYVADAVLSDTVVK